MPASDSGSFGQSLVQSHLKLAEVVGDARRESHKDELELMNWSWGETQTSPFTTDPKKVQGNVSMTDFQFSSRYGSASTQIMVYCASAKLLKSAVLTCEREFSGVKKVFLTVTMSDVMVSSYHVTDGAESGYPIDKVSLRFRKIEFKYVSYKPDGATGPSFTGSWDMAINKQ